MRVDVNKNYVMPDERAHRTNGFFDGFEESSSDRCTKPNPLVLL
jgi:hypothetical protein